MDALRGGVPISSPAQVRRHQQGGGGWWQSKCKLEAFQSPKTSKGKKNMGQVVRNKKMRTQKNKSLNSNYLWDRCRRGVKIDLKIICGIE